MDKAILNYYRKSLAPMRGYRFLKENNRLDAIAQINRELTEKKIKINSKNLNLIFGEGEPIAELIVRQYLLIRCAGISLNKSILEVFGNYRRRLVYPLPKEWIEVIESNGVKVAKFRSRILWFWKVLVYWSYGIFTISQRLFFSYNGILKNRPSIGKNYIYFDSLSKENLPQFNSNGESFDIISWYLRWPERIRNFDLILHNVKNVAAIQGPDGIEIKSKTDFLPEINSYRFYFLFLLWAFKAIPKTAVDIILNRWWSPFLLLESVKGTIMKYADPGDIAKEYLFNNSNWIYRPLWTYEAEKKGARISFYFYSTNSEDFKSYNGYPELLYGWKAMNWPLYLVWDRYQEDFVKRAVGNSSKILIVGPIWFQNSKAEFIDKVSSFVTVFDVQPVRHSYYVTLGTSREYFVPKIANDFLSDIYSVSKELKLKVILKRKRIIGKLAHPKYRNLIHNLESENDFISVDPNISAHHLIRKSEIVISMPFTSTALIGRELGKESIYYDPSGSVQKDDRAAHGIQVINSKEELKNWLEGKIRNHNRTINIQ